MNSLESYMNRVKGRLWMHMVGHTLMEDQHISFDDTSAKHLQNETIRRHIFPFISFSAFYANGYQMLKDYYIELPLSQTWSFMNYLMRLWIEDRIDSIRNCYEVAQDPIERAKVSDMGEKEYRDYMAAYFKEHHRGIARSRKDFLRYAEMSRKELAKKIRKVKQELKDKVNELRGQVGFFTWLKYRLASAMHTTSRLAASSMVIALIAVSLAESLKMIVIRLFNLTW